MEIVETYEVMGREVVVWRCPDCGYETQTYEGGEPAECIRCIENEARYENLEGGA